MGTIFPVCPGMTQPGIEPTTYQSDGEQSSTDLKKFVLATRQEEGDSSAGDFHINHCALFSSFRQDGARKQHFQGQRHLRFKSVPKAGRRKPGSRRLRLPFQHLCSPGHGDAGGRRQHSHANVTGKTNDVKRATCESFYERKKLQKGSKKIKKT